MQTPDRLWLTRTEAAALCGLSARQFDEAIRPRAKSAERGTAKTLRFDGPKIIEALIAYRVEQAKPSLDPEADPLLAGPNSPALERFRLARAKGAEMDLEERTGRMVRMAAMQEALRPAVNVMRGVGDRLARQFGNEAAEIFNEGVGEFEASVLRALTDDAGDDDGNNPDPRAGGVDADAPAADDGRIR